MSFRLRLIVTTGEFGDPFDERKNGHENGSPMGKMT